MPRDVAKRGFRQGVRYIWRRFDTGRGRFKDDSRDLSRRSPILWQAASLDTTHYWSKLRPVLTRHAARHRECALRVARFKEGQAWPPRRVRPANLRDRAQRSLAGASAGDGRSLFRSRHFREMAAMSAAAQRCACAGRRVHSQDGERHHEFSSVGTGSRGPTPGSGGAPPGRSRAQ